MSKMSESNKNIENYSVKLNVDCEEALKGLKAITREAKKATQALKELEEQQSLIDKINATTDKGEPHYIDITGEIVFGEKSGKLRGVK